MAMAAAALHFKQTNQVVIQDFFPNLSRFKMMCCCDGDGLRPSFYFVFFSLVYPSGHTILVFRFYCKLELFFCISLFTFESYHRSSQFFLACLNSIYLSCVIVGRRYLYSISSHAHTHTEIMDFFRLNCFFSSPSIIDLCIFVYILKTKITSFFWLKIFFSSNG